MKLTLEQNHQEQINDLLQDSTSQSNTVRNTLTTAITIIVILSLTSENTNKIKKQLKTAAA